MTGAAANNSRRSRASAQRGVRFGVVIAAASVLAACHMQDLREEPAADANGPYRAQISRTTYGIPHIKANDWGSLGYGYGYAQAQDSLCTLADAFVTYRGQRSRYFGADKPVPVRSTTGRPLNVDSDFYYRFVADDRAVDAFAHAQSASIRATVRGYAAGYDRYVRDLKADPSATAQAECRGAPWLADITERDVYRRMYAAMLAGGYANFVHPIVSARLPSGQAASRDDGAPPPLAQAYVQAGGAEGVGSNAIAFGADATGTGHGLLFGNPHWFWRGADHFYQAQLTIPGKLDVSGASFLGVPVTMIGFNRDVAWSLTVSSARRFGIFRLALAPGRPDAYLLDGKPVAMDAVTISIDALQPDGSLSPITRTLYRTRFGPLIDLSGFSPALAATPQAAYAIRDVNADNYRTFATFVRWSQADSLDRFIDVAKRDASMPWVNTLAIGRNDRRAWYGDVGAIPDVPSALTDRCAPQPLASAFAKRVPGVPLLDGSRTECDWASAPGQAQPGTLPSRALPALARTDYVANMNNSYRIANPSQPLSGFPPIFAEEPSALSLRARLGFMLVQQRLAGTDGYGAGGANVDSVGRMALNSRVLSAELSRADALAAACAQPDVLVRNDPASGKPLPTPQAVDLAGACAVLRAWDGTGTADARGANLWSAFWTALTRAQPKPVYRIPYDPNDPVHTPSGPVIDAALAREALGEAVLALRHASLPLDSRRGDALYVTRDSRRIPLYGGCSQEGYFTAACSGEEIDGPDGYTMNGNANGNTYMQIVTFDDGGPQAYTLLASSESDDPASAHRADYTDAYAKQRWLRVPFTDAQIGSDPNLSVTTIEGR
ncbi:penicillin acylase family protein [Paraburkholderia caballeronis]|uniref:Acyl-homoserine-lactone acylase n=1 Tax=Paraburkholderia caballeronis TaxID=416943 RepID=A0A1H7FDM6_9BURK|nr:penicillin acylase family protein [Paraburkholderia caballeronis]PXW25048.1 acyl-homoserine-lactone acylase [Paraburkholderia caballeronis]PXW93232.1 acyl-homoserine-lactone acylase [Paraburkholderia caballeronis]RAJ86683.1 acyl-homoserine-lactone acylase [Paraburkholderia caballeronis]SEE74021.1 acyl-homoserine-lactone acylase [Paraburkholderia caballeronis]SEK24088.1 acyl-homoserine-lactone acylase [Paraburkholderia caballeronis]